MTTMSLSANDRSGDAILNVEEGLARLMHDRVLYLQLLRRFLHDYREVMVKIRQALGDGQRAVAQVITHTLKGAAGMIGAQGVHQLAAALEPVLREPGADCEAALLALEAELQGLLATIEHILADASLPGAARPAQERPAMNLLLRHLAQLLHDGDGAAIDVLEQSAALLADGLGLDAYREISAAAHEFDFEAAHQALRARMDGKRAS